MDHPVVLAAVADWLSVGDLYRLRRALGQAPTWPAHEIGALVASRLRLRARRGAACTLEALAERVRTTHRCVECGVPSRRLVRVCEACARDPRSFRAMCTRAEARALARAHDGRAPRGFERKLCALPVARRTWRLYHWRRDVEALLRRG
jgi:hypothetical protein